MVTAREKKSEIAVIKKGNVFAHNVVTSEELLLIRRADSEAVRIDQCIIREGSRNTVDDLTIAIANFSSDSITDTLILNFDTTHYDISPAVLRIDLGSEEKQEYKCQLRIRDGSDIFPMPRFTIDYPFTSGKSCTLKNYLSIRRLKEVKKCKSAPILDGKLEDEIWKDVIPITNLGTYDGLANPPVERTEIYLCHDKENLYLAARCFESNFSQIRADATEHDGKSPWDDNLWLFFDTNYDQETYYQAIINSKAVIYDRLCRVKDSKREAKLEWDGPWEVKSGREVNAWILEMKIPKEGVKPFNKKNWGFNFRRLQPRPGLGDAGYWSIPFGHDPKNFGIIEFED